MVPSRLTLGALFDLFMKEAEARALSGTTLVRRLELRLRYGTRRASVAGCDQSCDAALDRILAHSLRRRHPNGGSDPPSLRAFDDALRVRARNGGRASGSRSKPARSERQPNGNRGGFEQRKSPLIRTFFHFSRREWDSNPRNAHHVQRFSRPPPSATRPSLQTRRTLISRGLAPRQRRPTGTDRRRLLTFAHRRDPPCAPRGSTPPRRRRQLGRLPPSDGRTQKALPSATHVPRARLLL